MSAVSIGMARRTGRQRQQGWPQLTGALDPPALQLGAPPAPNEAEEPGAQNEGIVILFPKTCPNERFPKNT